ncbi:hypothetical protein [Piscirickettsia salmonis]|uniref:hypothetical protein n=1 Tax=Piscirickettsia salmonis TaxID=1238 RepID=UPI000332C648|nr:hypothetical protein [Piscirickettsia salmonis]ERL60502.1 hypothetical protein K661_03178 [Piscirickettsia salmonis LF-89 = ATCC VR-1361]QNR79489.1 hypothetical protein ICC15_10555 [Piscirickettsia salmonis]WGZ73158.1 hypothetical protein E3220_16260 [Piscirickettsia salmonis]
MECADSRHATLCDAYVLLLLLRQENHDLLHSSRNSKQENNVNYSELKGVLSATAQTSSKNLIYIINQKIQSTIDEISEKKVNLCFKTATRKKSVKELKNLQNVLGIIFTEPEEKLTKEFVQLIQEKISQAYEEKITYKNKRLVCCLFDELKQDLSALHCSIDSLNTGFSVANVSDKPQVQQCESVQSPMLFHQQHEQNLQPVDRDRSCYVMYETSV